MFVFFQFTTKVKANPSLVRRSMAVNRVQRATTTSLLSDMLFGCLLRTSKGKFFPTQCREAKKSIFDTVHLLRRVPIGRFFTLNYEERLIYCKKTTEALAHLLTDLEQNQRSSKMIARTCAHTVGSLSPLCSNDTNSASVDRSKMSIFTPHECSLRNEQDGKIRTKIRIANGFRALAIFKKMIARTCAHTVGSLSPLCSNHTKSEIVDRSKMSIFTPHECSLRNEQDGKIRTKIAIQKGLL